MYSRTKSEYVQKVWLKKNDIKVKYIKKYNLSMYGIIVINTKTITFSMGPDHLSYVFS